MLLRWEVDIPEYLAARVGSHLEFHQDLPDGVLFQPATWVVVGEDTKRRIREVLAGIVKSYRA